MCLTSDLARFINTKIEKDNLVNVRMMTQEIEEDRLYKENDSKEEKPYKTIITDDFEKINVNLNTSQMEQWSMLCNVINYVQYNWNPVAYC